MTFAYLITFLLSGILVFLLNYINQGGNSLQHIASLFMILILFFLRRTFNQNSLLDSITRLALIFFTAFFIQNLVSSTGGFFSPILILIHLYILGASFILNSVAAFGFMLFSILLFFAGAMFNPSMQQLILQDLLSVGIYVTSFIVTVPLGIYLSRVYGLKDTVAQLLNRHIKLSAIREQSIMSGLSELVVTTDLNLKITSVNEAVKRLIDKTDVDIIGKGFFDVIKLTDSQGKPINQNSISLANLSNNISQIIKDYYLFVHSSYPTKVIIQIRPIIDLTGRVHQIAFLISDRPFDDKSSSVYLDKITSQHKALVLHLKNYLKTFQNIRLLQEVELLDKNNQDFLTTLELETKAVQPNLALKNIKVLVEKVVLSKTDFAQTFGVGLQLRVLPQEELLSMVAPVNVKWLAVLLEKLFDIAILIACSFEPRKIDIVLKDSGESIAIEIWLTLPKNLNFNPTDLFKVQYGNLGTKTYLSLGSGVEGTVAKRVADLLNIPINIQKENGLLELTVKIEKNPKPTPAI